MNYPIVFDSAERQFAGLGIAVLENASEIKVRQVINGEYTLSLTLPRNDPKWEFIREENFIYVDGQAFRIRSFEEMRDNTGKFISNIQCEHCSYDLNDLKHLPKMRDIVNVSPSDVFKTGFTDSDGTRVDGVLKNTDFLFESEDVGTTDLFLSKTTPRAVLNEFLNVLDCEVEFDNYTVRIKKRIGSENSGVVFEAGKNITEIKRKTDSSGLCTRLYPYGADYLDITSVNNKCAYIDSPLAGNYDYYHEDFRDYTDIDTPEELYERAQKEWSTEDTDGIDKPKVTYELQVLELKKIPGLAAMQKFSLGDGIRVRDMVLGIDINARITEYEYYPYEPKRSSVVLANFKETFGGIFAGIKKSQNFIERITDRRGKIEDRHIAGVMETMSVKFNEALVKKTVVHDYANMWVDDLANPTSVIALVDGMFAIANERGADGNWNWRTIGDGNGLVADSVVSNWVYAGEVDASQIKAGTINTSLITLSSQDGSLVIDSNKIEMAAADGTGLTISPESGLVYNHSLNSEGLPLVSTVLDSAGCGKLYTTYSSDGIVRTVYKEYVDKIYCATLGGSASDLLIYRVKLTGAPWKGIDASKVHAIVSPAEELSFATPVGGRINDIVTYECYVDYIEKTDDGIEVVIESSKKYVKSISGNTPNYEWRSLKFNVLVVAQ